MNLRQLLQIAAMGVGSVVVVACGSSNDPHRLPAVHFKIQRVAAVPKTMKQMSDEVCVEKDYMSKRLKPRRRARYMKPRFITIHSTANPNGDASDHSRALKKGRMGSLNWHFTVDQYHAIQHIPLNETGRHADRGGPGDMYSIGIEMCEVRSHNPIITWNRSAKLTAILMKQYNIPLRNVVPHYYWTRKNCPAPLLTDGRPGYKWSWFISRVDYYRRCLATRPNANNARRTR